MRIVAKIFGWLLTVAGFLLAVVFGFLGLLTLGKGPYGIIIALYMCGPLFLIGILFLFLGRFLLKRARVNTHLVSGVLVAAAF